MKKIKELSPKSILRILYILEFFSFLFFLILSSGISFANISEIYASNYGEISQDSFKFGAFIGFFWGSFFLFSYRLYRNIKDLNRIRKELKEEGKYS